MSTHGISLLHDVSLLLGVSLPLGISPLLGIIQKIRFLHRQSRTVVLTNSSTHHRGLLSTPDLSLRMSWHDYGLKQ